MIIRQAKLKTVDLCQHTMLAHILNFKIKLGKITYFGGLLGGTISVIFTWFLGALEDRHCEATLIHFIFGLAAMKSRV